MTTYAARLGFALAISGAFGLSSPTHASMPKPRTKLQQVFPGLPPVLKRVFGDTDVKFKNSPRLRIGLRTRGQSRAAVEKLILKKDSPAIRGTFTFHMPMPGGKGQPTPELARAFLEHLYVRAYPRVNKNEIVDKMIGEILDYGSAVLVGQKPPENRLIELWWKTRMHGEPSKPKQALQRGDKILVGLWTNGYKGSSFTPMDFGHAALGVRTVGGDPSDDFMLNPGAKTPEGYAGNIFSALRGDPRVPNRTSTFNLWDWIEAQRAQRFLNIDIRYLRLSPVQFEVLQEFRKELSSLQWGPFTMLANNCADGALDIYNSLLPLDRGITRNDVGWLVTPEETLNFAALRFGEVLEAMQVEGATPPPGVEKTPDGDVVALENRAETPAFKTYIKLENAALR